MFKEIEDAWTQDSVGYDELVKKTAFPIKVTCVTGLKELKKVLGDRQLKVFGCRLRSRIFIHSYDASWT